LHGNIEILPNLSIKQYTDNLFRLTNIRKPHKMDREQPGRDVNAEKIDQSLSRSRSKVFEYAICNEWEYFVTLTLDKNKMDRYDLPEYIKKLGKWIQIQKRKDLHLKYLLIPEPHKDGAWHMHGLINGLREQDLRKFTLDEDIPEKMKKMIRSGRKLYDIPAYRKKFGFVSVEKVENSEAVAKYVTKYISKTLQSDLKREKEKKLYYVSRGLKTAEKVIEGYLPVGELYQITFDFENDYIRLKDMNYTQFNAFIQSYLNKVIIT